MLVAVLLVGLEAEVQVNKLESLLVGKGQVKWVVIFLLPFSFLIPDDFMPLSSPKKEKELLILLILSSLVLPAILPVYLVVYKQSSVLLLSFL